MANLSEIESDKSSTWRELFAVTHALISFKSLLKNKYVLWHTDNFAVSIIAKSGSIKEPLQYLALKIYDVCKENNIDFNIKWIPREQNTGADYLSRLVDYDDWQTTKTLFTKLNNIWGPFTVDRFASNINTHLPKFISKYCCPGTSRVNALSISWFGENNYSVPPIHLITKTIQHMSLSQCKGALIVPHWPSAAFWPLLVDHHSKFLPFIKDHQVCENPSLWVVRDFIRNHLSISFPRQDNLIELVEAFPET